MAVPSAPRNVTLTPVKGGAVLQWTAPATPNGLTGYRISINDSVIGSGFKTSADADATLSWADLGVAPGTTVGYSVQAYNGDGFGPFAAPAGTYTAPARTLMDGVRIASVQANDGTTIELRSSGGATPTITLGYSKLADGIGFTTIANVPVSFPRPGMGTFFSGGAFGFIGSGQDFALAASPRGDVFVVGLDAGSPNVVKVVSYGRGGTATAPNFTWGIKGAVNVAIAGLNGSGYFHRVAADYSAGVSGKPTIVLLARAAGAAMAKHLAAATVDANLLLASAPAAAVPAATISTAIDPSWLPLPPSSSSTARVDAALDLAAAPAGSGAIYAAANGYALATVANGIITATSAKQAGFQYPSNRVRVLHVATDPKWCVIYETGGNLKLDFYVSGGLSGSYTIPGSTFLGGAPSGAWDAVYNARLGLVSVYVRTAARSVSRIDVSPATFLANPAVVITAALGPASSTNSELRVPHGLLWDERRLLLEAHADVAGAGSLAVYDEQSGNLAPNAPALTPRSNFDATTAATFAWAFSDPNTVDAQSAYQLVIEKVSDGTVAFDSGKVTSATSSRVLAANTLTNGTAYRWKVRTYDTLGLVGTYSSYGTFTPSAAGTLTITDPAADGAALNVSQPTVSWSYTQANGYTQAQRRVRVTRTDTGALVSDTGMVASTTLSYTLPTILSGVPYRVDLDILNTNGQGPATVSRTFTSVFNSPMVPTFAVAQGENYLEVTVTNPAPVGSLPEATGNAVQRRLTGSSDGWVTVGLVGYNGTYQDRQVASGEAYDYLVTAIAATGTTNSDVVPAVAPGLVGVWLHAVADPEGTERHYPYQADTRAESVEVSSTLLSFVGRRFPVAEYGVAESQGHDLSLRVPYEDAIAGAVEALRELVRSRDTLCMRDNRGRVVFGVPAGKLSIEDGAGGATNIGLSLARVDYTEGL